MTDVINSKDCFCVWNGWVWSRLKRFSALVFCYWVIRCCIFNIAWNVSILLTIEVIINLDWSNQFQRSSLHLKWFSLRTIEEISALVCCWWVCGWCIFNIALNVSSLLKMEVMTNFHWCNQFQYWFIHLKWFIYITIEKILVLVCFH